MTLQRYSLRLLYAAVLLTVMTACGQSVTSSATSDGARRTYHDGNRTIEVQVMLDRLSLVRAVGANQPQRTEVYLMRNPVASLAHLEQVAQQMRAAQQDITEISAYVRLVDQPAAEPERLTSYLAVRCAATTDINAIANPNLVIWVKDLDYSPDTKLVRVEGRGLVRVLDVADALRRHSSVVFAVPQLEHLATLRSTGPSVPQLQR